MKTFYKMCWHRNLLFGFSIKKIGVLAQTFKALYVLGKTSS